MSDDRPRRRRTEAIPIGDLITAAKQMLRVGMDVIDRADAMRVAAQIEDAGERAIAARLRRAWEEANHSGARLTESEQGTACGSADQTSSEKGAD